MDTLAPALPQGRRYRRQYSSEFRAQVIEAASQPGVSVAAIALANGMNANLLRRWVIRVDTIWLGLEPLDMCAGTESALARVVSAFGAARAHHGYVARAFQPCKSRGVGQLVGHYGQSVRLATISAA